MTRILLDAMCGGLRPYLRLCGHDAAYALERDVEADDRLLELAAEEERLVVTHDRRLADRADRSVLLTTRDPTDQLAELAEAGIGLAPDPEPSRCGRCNGPLETAAPDAETPEYVPDGLPRASGADAEDAADRGLWRCRDCGQYFWKGSHWDRMGRTLEEVRNRG